MKTAFLSSLITLIAFAMPGYAEAQIYSVQAVETIEIVQVTETSEETTVESDSPGLLKTIGRMHPALVHTPIGFLIALLLLELFSFSKRPDNNDNAGVFMCGITAISTLPATLSGFLRTSEIFEGRPVSDLLNQHRILMMATGVLIAIAFSVRFAKKMRFRNPPGALYFSLLIFATLCAVYGGHLGGKLVFGENYLPF